MEIGPVQEKGCNHGDATDAGPSSNLQTDRSKNEAVVRVHKESLFYNMNYSKRGIALIFNHEKYTLTRLKERAGTSADRDNLVNCLQKLGFEVDVCDDYKCEAVMQKVEEVAELDHSDYDCFLMCVLSHGEEGSIVYAKDAAYQLDYLWKPFTADKCKTLAGKPKLFFFQACQGEGLDTGVKVTQVDSNPSFKIPSHADFLLAYSTIPGFYSWRNTSKGSWFIQALCMELADNSYKVDLLTLLTFVNRRVATDFESYVPDSSIMNQKKQIPYITFTLTRLVKFQQKHKQM